MSSVNFSVGVDQGKKGYSISVIEAKLEFIKLQKQKLLEEHQLKMAILKTELRLKQRQLRNFKQ